ncbi:MAG TPA: c-type cytochrome domain-containing protein [Planctomycetota bacterium]|nr:c-type cytochrome domain-containing protein [Planctomycetota bacterium]
MNISLHTVGGFLGWLHPALVHFPIALLAIAALLEVVQILRRTQGLSSTTLLLTCLAAPAAAVASILGLLLKGYEGTEGPLVDVHAGLGLGATVAAALSATLLAMGRTRPRARWGGRIALGVGGLLVLSTGFLGGEMVFGENHLFGVFTPKPSVTRTSGDSLVDFEREVAPVLRVACLKCHGPTKQKGHLRLDSREALQKGGEDGPCLVPGHREKSPLYLLLLEKDAGNRMPQKAEPLPPPDIERIGKWIDQGAPWPDGLIVR